MTNFFISDGMLGGFIAFVMLVNCVLGISFATQSGWKLIYSSWAAWAFLLIIALVGLSTPPNYEISHVAGGVSIFILIICFGNLREETICQINSEKIEQRKRKSW